MLERGHRHRFHIHHFKTHRLRAVSLERPKSSDHAVENHTQREQIRPRIGRFAQHLLRRHIGRAADDLSRLSYNFLVQAGNAKIRNFCMALFGD